jgi:hypothetical protein
MGLLFMKEPALRHQGFIKTADGDGIEDQLDLVGRTPVEFSGLVHQLVIEGGIIHAKRLGGERTGNKLSTFIFGGKYHAIGQIQHQAIILSVIMPLPIVIGLNTHGALI